MEDLKNNIDLYRELGFLPFPVCKPLSNSQCIQHSNCKKIGKVPLLKDWTKLLPNERHDRGIDELFEKFNYDCNIGLVTGKIGNLVVLDIDGEEGFNSLNKIGLGNSNLNSGAIVTTGRIGGFHYWYSPNGIAYPKKIGFQPKLDFLGEGGFVLAPKSTHQSGNVYKFLNSIPDPNSEFPVIPTWMVDIILSSSNDNFNNNEFSFPIDTSKIGIGQRTLKFLNEGASHSQREEMIHAIVNLLGRGVDREEVIQRVFQALYLLSPQNDPNYPWTQEDVIKVVEEFEKNGIKDPKGIDDNHSIRLPSVKKNLRTKRLTDALKEFQEKEERDWLIEGIIRRGEFLWLYSPPNAGKTFIALDWGMHIASGRKYQEYLNVQKGKVLIIEQDRLMDPIRYLEAHLENNDWNIREIEENLLLSVDSDFNLRDDAGLNEILGYIDSEKPDLVIMDSCYSFCLNGISDSDYEFVHKFKESMVSRDIAVIFLDHTVATPEFEGNSSKTDLDKLYGGSAKRKILDSGLYVKGFLKDRTVDLIWAKYQGEFPSNMRISFQPRVGFKMKVLFSPDKHTWSKQEIEVVEYISRHGPKSIVELEDALGRDKRSLKRTLGNMVIRRQVDRNEEIYSLGVSLRQPQLSIEEEDEN